jgi:hypothetical protein
MPENMNQHEAEELLDFVLALKPILRRLEADLSAREAEIAPALRLVPLEDDVDAS